MIREGRLINVPRLITEAVLVAPIKKIQNGININAPPPPLIVESENARTPETKMIRSNNTSIFFRISSIN